MESNEVAVALCVSVANFGEIRLLFPSAHGW